MAKVALLIGVSEYESFTPLPGAVKDVEAIKQVLQDPYMGKFEAKDVQTLVNPEPQEMREAIEALFSDRQKEDLVLLYFSGHGIKDDLGKLHFGTRLTRKNPQGELVFSTAVSASFVHEIMDSNRSRSRRKVVILDCCFSGAFAEGLKVKDDGSLDIKTQLGGEGRAILTSSTSTQYSFEDQKPAENFSIYTRYLVEGIKTGAADEDGNGLIYAGELHDYAKRKVQEVAPGMKPEFFPSKEGTKIILAEAPVSDPKIKYRREVEHCVRCEEITPVDRDILEIHRKRFGLSRDEAAIIEDEVIRPYQEYQKNLQLYKDAFRQAKRSASNLRNSTLDKLRRYHEVLGLKDEDIASIHHTLSMRKRWLIGAGVTLALAIGIFGFFYLKKPLISESEENGDKTLADDTKCIRVIEVGDISTVYLRDDDGEVINKHRVGEKLEASNETFTGRLGNNPRTTYIKIKYPKPGWMEEKFTEPCNKRK
ncbi:MAG: hypothetical protein F6J89_12940 [Symploca sp. SIO1C4]|uniref:Peptidase C14 caspase domain-containing protein n=1 Tax=Symploca sp. SIO1C4 TaxID=2607765 RepID=A0A6B3NAG1_9CYAN|nr:hypothetical protein [Symploca sp. SIO1C4]